MRLDDVEIKVSFASDDTAKAVNVLQLVPRLHSWQIYFCEDVNPGALATPLLDLQVVLRARARGDEEDDVTVKLRPCRVSQLTDRWINEMNNLKVEADWSGDRHLLAASNTDKPKIPIAAVAAHERLVKDLFTDQQKSFLAECADAVINLESLTLLPPVTSVRWKHVVAAPAELELRAERWTVDDLDFLEVSATSPIKDAAAKQAALVQFLKELGLSAPDDQETKTRQVMEHLVFASRAVV